MSWYEFGHRKDNFVAYLPDGKEPIDTGFYYQELIAFGGWYFAPVKGSGQTRFYNRVYFNPCKKEIEDFNLDERATMFINLGKTKFGQLEIKLDPNGFRESILWMEEANKEISKILSNWRAYYDYIADKVVKSYIVVFPDGRNDGALMFNTKNNAVIFADSYYYKSCSAGMRKKYGVQIYEPHKETPFYILGGDE